ncbi:hypothetical protein [Nocardioides ganghwensis]|uniref:DUF4178 domain-containing protein n=1 Tax=Nocardioides ganghwensis TaxID=252230 RepID=A0A4Q2SM26_9ACTN|nr:hypothetical protein [Nocardioides ganghwensis]MBD3944784.1 hypothetical protein [Nocardioides ganghwensis]RYC05194.1 hypothetical protein EUA07_01510 [Nocardioides ganghwensis]
MAEWFHAMEDWLRGWNEPGTLGDVLPWLVTSMVTVLATLVLSLRRRRQERREQALQIAAWVDESPQDGSVIRVRNSSRQRIESVAALVARMPVRGEEPVDWDHDAQFFACLTIGPERTVTFPLRDSLTAVGHFRVRLYFSDHAGRPWILWENGTLGRTRRAVADSFFTGTSSGRTAEMMDHSGTVGPDGNRVELANIPVQRLDVDEEDGTNISLVLLPKGKSAEPSAVAELTRDGKRVARVYLDAEDRIMRLTVCNLPEDTWKYCYPQYLFAERYTVLFGTPGQDVGELLDTFDVGDAWVLGGKHTPWNEMAHLAYDSGGRLRAIMFNRRSLVPGFLTD